MATIDATIESVARQDWPCVEHILIDGGSTDGTADRIRRHAAGLRHFVSEPDKGLYDAMNKGLEVARGDLVCFLNAGDRFVADDVLSKIAAHASDEPRVLFGRAIVSGKSGRRLMPPAGAPARRWLGPRLPSHQATFYPRAFAQRSRYDIGLGSAADTDYTLRALEAFPGVLLDIIVSEFVLGGVSNRFATLGEAMAASRSRARVARLHGRRLFNRDMPKYLAGPLLGWAIRSVAGPGVLDAMRQRLGAVAKC